MKSRLCRLFILVSLMVFVVAEVNAQENFNVEQLSLISPGWSNGIHDVAVQGIYAYLAGFGDGFRIIDVSDPEIPVEVHPVSEFDMLSCVRYIAVSGDYLYLASNDRGIDIINIANPEQAYFVKQVELTDLQTRLMQGMEIEGDRLFVNRGTQDNSIVMIDISDPPNAEVIASFGSYVVGFEVQEDQVYLNSYGDIIAFDITDPAAPETLWVYDSEHGLGVTGLSVKGDYAYLAANESGLIVVDLTTLQEVARLEELAVAYGTQIVGNWLYVNYGNPDCPLVILNLQNPVDPEILGTYYPPEDLSNFVVVNNIAYVADSRHGLRLVDVSDSENPSEISFINEYAYYRNIQADESGLRVLGLYGVSFWDMQNPSAPHKFGYREGYEFGQVQISGSMVYLSISNSHPPVIEIFDINNPASPALVNTYESQGEYISSLLIRDHYLLLAESDGLHVMDISNPLNIVEVGFLEEVVTETIACDDHYIYLTNYSNQIMVVDYSNPSELEVVGLWNNPNGVWHLKASNGFVYASSGNDVLVYDSHFPANSDPIIELDISHENYFLIGLDVVDDAVFVLLADWDENPNKVEVYDFVNLDVPTLCGSFDTFTYVETMAVHENLIYIMNSDTIAVYRYDFTTSTEPVVQTVTANSFELLSNYPNPFNSTTQIRFEVAGQHHVSLAVFDMLGRQVTTLANQNFTTGTHVIPWNGTNAAGNVVASGRYFVMAKANDNVSTLPIVLLK